MVRAGQLRHRIGMTDLQYAAFLGRQLGAALPEIRGAATGHGTALEYFPERGGLVRVLGGGVHFYREARKIWSVLSGKKLPVGPYHNFAAYSAPFRAVLFGGGNGSRDVYRLDASGKVTAGAVAPVGLGIGQSVHWVDPATGELLVLHKGGRWFSYHAGRDAWRELPGQGVPLALRGSSHHVVAAPIPTHGVTMLFTSAARGLKVHLHKHAARG